MSKRKCSFSDNLQKEFPFLKKSLVSIHNAYCIICKSDFSIGTGGKSHIMSHVKSEKHKKYVKHSEVNQKLTSFMQHGLSDKTNLIRAAEGVFVYHNVMHNSSFRLLDCTSKIMKKVHDSAFSCGRTKSEAIVKNVLEKFALEELKVDLDVATFVSLYFDASNHGSTKMFPILVRYFSSEKGICVKLLEFQNLPGETSDLISKYLLDTINSHGLTKKVMGFCADNANTNFGGYTRKGSNNVFSKLQAELTTNIVGIGCSAHILNNTMHTAADNLPIDIESILIKIYSHFHVFTVRVETLQDYCNYVNTEYSKVLGYCKTRWLSLLPAVSRLIEMFQPLKAYFLSLDMCPFILKSFFKNEAAEVFLFFIQKQSSIFHNAVKEIEGQNVTVIEVAIILRNVLKKYEGRLSEKFIPCEINKMMQNLSTKEEILHHMFTFYENCIQYLKKWIKPFEVFLQFVWVNLKEMPSWDNISGCSSFLAQISKETCIDDDSLFDEFMYMKTFIDDEQIAVWNKEKFQVEARWIHVFQSFKKNHTPFGNLLKIVEALLCLPGTNAPTERIFSAVNTIWTSEKTNLSISTLKALLVVKTNLNVPCVDFYDYLLKNDKLLIAIHSAEKYQDTVQNK